MPIDLSLLGQTQFLIPFLFVLAVVFGVLRIGKVFKGNPAVEMVIALVIAFFAASYQPFTSVLFQYLPSITWFFIAMFFLVFILEIFGIRKPKEKEEHEKNLIIYGILLLILFSIGVSRLEGLAVQIPLIGGGENIALLIGLIFIIGIFWYAYGIKAEAPQQKGG